MSRMRHCFAIALAALFAPVIVSGQNTTLTGVARSETQAAVRGAFVQIPSLNLTTITNDQGYYSIVVPAARATGTVTMTVTSIGYKPIEVQISLRPGRITQDVIMMEQAVALDEVVVTGTAGRQERRAQAAVVSTISATKVAEFAPIQNVQNLLQARTPGVVLRMNSGTTGTEATIRIRGQASINLSNEPLVFIDGIRAQGGGRQLYGVGNQGGSALNDIKIEDIENIEIVKGPAAATLYGADANAGVINIITKRGRQGSGFTQQVTVEYGEADPNFTPPQNAARCTQAVLNNPTAFPGCVGKALNEVIFDNPLVREASFINGRYRNFGWSLRGGGERFSVFTSLGFDDDNGTLPNNEYGHMSGTANFDFFAHEKLRMEFGFGMVRTTTQLPRNDNDIYGYLGGGLLGDPRTLGGPKDGWYGNNRQTLAIASYENVDKTLRVRPRFSVNYSPFQWFTHRMTLGGDLSRTQAYQFWAKNSIGWFDDAPRNSGQVGEGRQSIDRITFDYLGNVTRSLHDLLRADLSFGSQILTRKTDLTNATGTGLINNDVRSVNAAAQLTGGGQSSSQDRQVGFFGQLQLTWRDRVYLQLGGRVDQSSSFGADSEPFYSPKVGVSYVISDESFFRSLVPENAISTLRMRAAYGVTGRSPTSGARSTYSPTTNQISPTAVGIGVSPNATGNPTIKAEKGKEWEVGFETGLLRDRLGLDVTWFRKVSDDAILSLPIAPSLGAGSPSVNVGSLLNTGFEIASNARVLTFENVALEFRAAVNTLRNEVLDLGGTPETTTRKKGFPLGGTWGHKIKEIDVARNLTIVSDTFEYLGNSSNLPKWETTLSSTLTLFKSLSLYVQADGRGGRLIYNNTDQFRDRQNGFSPLSVLGCLAYEAPGATTCTDASKERYMSKFGCVAPCNTTATGAIIYWQTQDGRRLALGDVRGNYDEDGSFFKLREASLSYRVPRNLVERFMRAQTATFTLGMRNIQTWTDFTGLDPESDQFLTVPAPRSWTARLNVSF
ncbi:MAG: SusC/RagA family TonB-linked outer membrane protein [Longimicrobiales bacterium]